jgi:hypothetical protein
MTKDDAIFIINELENEALHGAWISWVGSGIGFCKVSDDDWVKFKKHEETSKEQAENFKDGFFSMSKEDQDGVREGFTNDVIFGGPFTDVN